MDIKGLIADQLGHFTPYDIAAACRQIQDHTAEVLGT